MNSIRRSFLMLLVACVSYAGALQSAQAALIGTEAVAAAQPAAQSDARAQVLAQLDRPDLVQALTERGVDIDAARARVASLDDAEAARLAQMIDSAPAGASGVLGVLVFIFVLLLVTDILGLTKVFPFTRSVR
jgi:hypothetical protein